MENKTVTVFVADRICLGQILPKEGDYLTLVVSKSLMEKVGLTPEDFKKFNIVQQDSQISWDGEKDKGLKVELTPQELKVITAELKKLEESKKLQLSYLKTYEKFCVETPGNSESGPKRVGASKSSSRRRKS